MALAGGYYINNLLHHVYPSIECDKPLLLLNFVAALIAEISILSFFDYLLFYKKRKIYSITRQLLHYTNKTDDEKNGTIAQLSELKRSGVMLIPILIDLWSREMNNRLKSELGNAIIEISNYERW